MSDESNGLLAKIKEAMAAGGRTPSELEAMSGVDRSSIWRFLNGKRDLRGSALDKICKALGLVVVQAEDVQKRGK